MRSRLVAINVPGIYARGHDVPHPSGCVFFGSIDEASKMTAIAVWFNNESAENPGLWVAADSRIGDPSAAALLEDGAKIFSLPVVCRAPGSDGFFTAVSYAHSCGYCFAGSTLMGQNAYLALLPLLGNLVARAGYAPFMADVARYIHAYLIRTFDDFKGIAGQRALFEVALFGYCHRTQRLSAFHFAPQLVTGIWTLRCTERADIVDGHSLYLGDEKVRMHERFAAATASGGAPGRPLSRMPRHVIQDCILDDTFPSIGGDLQLGIADFFGYRPFKLVRPRVVGKPEAYESYLGRELTPDLAFVGEAMVGGLALA
jgi:hypothetical protein